MELMELMELAEALDMELLLIMAVLWALFSGAVVALTEREGSQREAVGWTASFGAASLVAAFCFGMLL